MKRTSWQAIVLLLSLLIVGGSVSRSGPSRAHIIKSATALPDFNFLAWELNALGRTVFGGKEQLQDGLDDEAQVRLVRAYFQRATRIGEKEKELQRLITEEAPVAAQLPGSGIGVQATGQEKPGMSPLGGARSGARSGARPSAAIKEANRELAALRRQQAEERVLVESVLQQQIQEEIRRAGLGLPGMGLHGIGRRDIVWPPVQFAFVEPPLKLTVSARDRITTLHSRVLQAEYDPVTLEESERAIEDHTNLSAHISRIGGMAVFPAMVVESSSLEWVLATVAHEWVHHYLFLFPLGLRYATSDDLTTLNETVADIVGVEIAARLKRRLYDTALPSAEAAGGSNQDGSCACSAADTWMQTYELEQSRWERYGRPLPFGFQRAMRETRLHVDTLLEAGLVETAETYMEGRRRFLAANGYHLRVLNQAYFAFHGSYATGAAASNPIGPMLQQLRAESDDLAHFLGQVRWFTGLSDLETSVQSN
jgi:hypothetical protein